MAVLKRTLAVLIGMTIFLYPVFAAAPRDVVLSYDVPRGVLHVSAKHPTDRQDRYYIRLLVVYRNGEKAKEVEFHRQKSPAGMEEGVELEAKAGDNIRVELFVSNGGSAKAEYTVP